jgi:NAD(P)-dependent dehydrogenase (short-subunit alcohol dehydrogenase family)
MGGRSGIGVACAATLTREGAKVLVPDLDDTGSQAVVDNIGNAGDEAIFLHQDSNEESWPATIETAERRFGRLDVIVAIARPWTPTTVTRSIDRPRYTRITMSRKQGEPQCDARYSQQL